MKTFTAVFLAGSLIGLQGTANSAAGDQLYAHPGHLVSVNGTHLNLYCMGTGTPAVIFDSG
jgi:hypothetical protein